MTTEEDFKRLLVADLTDWQSRLVFADWLQDRGDTRAEGYRALVQTNRGLDECTLGYPEKYYWYNYKGYKRGRISTFRHWLPFDWFILLNGGNTTMSSVSTEAFELENSAAIAFTLLSTYHKEFILKKYNK